MNGRDSHHRDVEPHVLRWLGHLHDSRARAGEASGTRDSRVGPFHRLDRHHRRVLHDDRLSDVEARDGIGHPVAERQVGLLAVGERPRRDQPRPCEEWREKRGRIEQLDAVIPHHVGQRGNQRVGVLRPQPEQHGQQQAI
ncbi:MAG TPA: hypothetical protein VF332_05480, partial [Vicinamibacterales bacterium]